MSLGSLSTTIPVILLSIQLLLPSLLLQTVAQCPTRLHGPAGEATATTEAAIVASLIVDEVEHRREIVTPATAATPDTASSNTMTSAEDDSDFSWTEFDGSCYRLFPRSLAWFPAEAACRSFGGHLASIGSDHENRLVGRLGGCRDTWIGRFATDYHRVTDPASYEWTDGSSGGGYSRHNFSATAGGGSAFDPHMGAVRASGLAWTNAYYHQQLPYVCEVPAQRVDSGQRCLTPFAGFRNSCYWLSDFETSFVEASLHCERELRSHVASVHSPDELAFLGTLQLDSDTCRLGSVWLGLIKQNPCRPGKQSDTGPEGTGAGGGGGGVRFKRFFEADVKGDVGGDVGLGVGSQSPCYQWTDFSGQHSGYPPWQAGQPLLNDWKVNCASLSEDGLVSEMCHARRRFVCKRPL